MKRSLKTLVACAAFAICMCATMIVSFAATDLKIDPAALVTYSGQAATEEGAAVPGGELFIGLDAGSYTFADLADCLEDYGLQYQISTDSDAGSVYLIGSAIEIGPSGTFYDPITADAVYHYHIVAENYLPVITTIGLKNASEVASAAIAGVTDTIQNQAPEAYDAFIGGVTDIYGNVVGAVSEAADSGALDAAQEALGTAIDNVADTIGTVVDNAADALQDMFAGIDFSDWLSLFQ